MGATATGKTTLALALSRRLPLEIVNCDASQFYVGMDIGTAKPTPQQRSEVPHHLFDVSPPSQPLDAGSYAVMADATIRQILQRGNIPLLVGGTGMYIRSVIHGLAATPDVSPEVLVALRNELCERGTAALHHELSKVDPEAAGRIQPGDPQRILRALAVHRQSGVPLSEFQRQHQLQPQRVEALLLGVAMSDEVLRQRLIQRVDAMIREGLVDEVRRLVDGGLDPDVRTFKALGYRETLDHIRGRISLDDLKELLFRRHWQYVRRQRTWFRKVEGVVWLTKDDVDEAESRVRSFLAKESS
jgi:tRNA dimethylallyltransferase